MTTSHLVSTEEVNRNEYKIGKETQMRKTKKGGTFQKGDIINAVKCRQYILKWEVTEEGNGTDD